MVITGRDAMVVEGKRKVKTLWLSRKDV